MQDGMVKSRHVQSFVFIKKASVLNILAKAKNRENT